MSMLIEEMGAPPGEKYDAGKHPLLMMNTAGTLTLIVTDPVVIQDMLVTKNALLDKTGAFQGVFQNLFGKAFLFSKSDEDWKAKRKACAHAFYKDRLVHMLDTLKKRFTDAIEQWTAEIEASPTGSTQIELSKDIIKVMQRFLLEVFFGDDLETYTFEIHFRKPGGGSELREVNMSEAIDEVFGQTELTIGTRLPNPIWRSCFFGFGVCLGFTSMEKLSDKNSAILRERVGNYVRKRRSGEIESKVSDKSDILSLFFQSPEIFTEDVIIDELIDFMVAATQTTQRTTQGILCHFATNKASLDRVRAEFEACVGSTKGKPLRAFFKEDMNLENCNELTYLGYVIQETLRMNPIAPLSSQYWFEKDTKIGDIQIKAY